MGRHARLEAEFPDFRERLCVINAPVEIHRHGIDGESAEPFDLTGVPYEHGDRGLRPFRGQAFRRARLL